MRIWIVNHYAQMPSEAGLTRDHALSWPLVQRGHEVTIVSSAFHHRTRTSSLAPGESSRVETSDGITFVRLATPPYRDNGAARFWNMVQFGQQVRHHPVVRGLPRPDVIVGSSPHLFSAWAGEYWARKYRVPFVLEVRDVLPAVYVSVGGYSPHHPAIVALGRLEQYLYRRARRIITPLSALDDYLAGCGVPRERVVWIPNGVDLSLVPPVTPAPAGERLQVIYAGAFGPANDLGTVLEAAALLKAQGWEARLGFTFIGDGHQRAMLEERAHTRGLGNVVFRDAVPKAEIYPLLSASDIGLLHVMALPEFKYGISPNKLFDYMAVGRPVVCAATTPDDPVRRAGAGLSVPSQDPPALAAALRKLAEMSPEQRDEIGRRGRQFVEQQHSFGILSRQFEAALEAAVAEGV